MTDISPLTARQQQALERQRQILDTALSLFAKQGYAATSTKQIAREADITEGLIFHYFPKKSDLLKALLNERHAFIQDMVTTLTIDDEKAMATELRRVAKQWLTMHRQERNLVTILLTESHSNAEMRGLFHETIHAVIGHFETYLQNRIDAGKLRADLPLHTMAMSFFAPLLLFFISHQHLTAQAWNQQIDDFVESTIEQWLHGVAVTT